MFYEFSCELGKAVDWNHFYHSYCWDNKLLTFEFVFLLLTNFRQIVQIGVLLVCLQYSKWDRGRKQRDKKNPVIVQTLSKSYAKCLSFPEFCLLLLFLKMLNFTLPPWVRKCPSFCDSRRRTRLDLSERSNRRNRRPTSSGPLPPEMKPLYIIWIEAKCLSSGHCDWSIIWDAGGILLGFNL